MATGAHGDEPPAVEAADLSFAFLPGGPAQLYGISFALPKRCRCLIVGQNGAGKTTLLELLAGAKMALAGAVKVLGEDPFRGASGRRVALVQGGWRGAAGGALAEDRAAFLRVWQLLGMADPGTGESPLPPDSGRAARLFAALGLARLLGRYCGSLSDGERRKVELARKLVEPKEVVLLDEATTDLDLLSRRSLHQFLAEEDATVISVTHVFDGLEGWATHLAHLHEGRLIRLEQAPGQAALQSAGGLFGLVAGWLAEAAAAGDRIGSPPQAPTATDLTPGAANVPSCQVRGLSFAYAPGAPAALVVDGLELPPTCRCILVGPNGAGKSSLLAILAGRRMVLEGEVRVLGLAPFHEHAQLDPQAAILSSEWKRQVAELSGGRSLTLKDLAASTMQDLVAGGSDMQALAMRTVRLVQMLGIDPTKPLGALSDGMMRRVQIALKLLRPSKVLFVDEVTADLDVLARQALLSFLREESVAGCAVVYCTHIMDGLDGWGTHVLRLRPYGAKGDLIALEQGGAPGALLERALAMLEEDALLPEPPPQAVVPKASLSRGGEELPPGWASRGACHAGAYGSHAWNADMGSEESWTFSSAAPAPGPLMPAGRPPAAGQAPFPGAAPGAPLGAPLGAAPPWSPAPAFQDPCPFGAGPRANAMPLEALVAGGAVLRDRGDGS